MDSFNTLLDCVLTFSTCSCRYRLLCTLRTSLLFGLLFHPLLKMVQRLCWFWLILVSFPDGEIRLMVWLNTNFINRVEFPLRIERKRSSFWRSICWFILIFCIWVSIPLILDRIHWIRNQQLELNKRLKFHKHDCLNV